MRLYPRFFKGVAELDHQIEKFRKLRNDYTEANRPRHAPSILNTAAVPIT